MYISSIPNKIITLGLDYIHVIGSVFDETRWFKDSDSVYK